MGDVGDSYREGNEIIRERKQTRREENLAYLQENNVEWKWVDKLSDHILINGEIDYYLGKTYWSNRTTRKSGYLMLRKLIGA